ncbi:MAG TPA: hypothetical protein VHZ50_13175 [Puia sp.]|nr:hypothetical protein [Puia sp.]
MFAKNDKNDSAFYYARESYVVGLKGNYFPDILEATSFLSAYFKNKKEYDSAFVYEDVAFAAKDNLFSEEKVK